MNTAKRLAHLLSQVQSNKHSKALDIYKDVFGVDSCFEVVSRLLMCEEEVKRLEEKLPDNVISKKTIGDIRHVINCSNIEASINKNLIPPLLMSLNAAGSFMENDIFKYDDEKLTEIADMLVRLDEKIDRSDIDETRKEVLRSFTKEILDGLNLIEYCGTRQFAKHLVKAGGTFVLYNNVFKESGLYDSFVDIFRKATKLLGDISTWYGAYALSIDILNAIQK